MRTRAYKNDLAKIRRATKKVCDLAHRLACTGVRACTAIDAMRICRGTFSGSYMQCADELDTALAELREVYDQLHAMKPPFTALKENRK